MTEIERIATWQEWERKNRDELTACPLYIQHAYDVMLEATTGTIERWSFQSGIYDGIAGLRMLPAGSSGEVHYVAGFKAGRRILKELTK